MNLESEFQNTLILNIQIKYIANLKLFSDLCKIFQGKNDINSSLEHLNCI